MDFQLSHRQALFVKMVYSLNFNKKVDFRIYYGVLNLPGCFLRFTFSIDLFISPNILKN